MLADWFDNLRINIYLKENNQGLYEKVKRIAVDLQDKLNRRPWFESKAYTSHDFDHHVRNVLTYASEFISLNIKSFSCEELFYFECACILHDLAMTCTYDHRDDHSLVGALDTLGISGDTRDVAIKSFENISINLRSCLDCDEIPGGQMHELFYTVQTQFSYWINLFIDEEYQRELISTIILGHSDIKINTSNGKFSLPTLNDTFYQNSSDQFVTVNGITRPLYIQVLAALLRWADEMDCSYKRVGSNEPTFPETMDKEQLYSKRCWDKLKLIRNIDITTQPIKIRFRVSNKIDCKLVYEVEEKLRKEWENILTVLCKHIIGKTYLYLGDFCMVGESEQQNTQYSNYKEKRTASHEILKTGKLDIEEIRELIRHRIDENHLYKEGHYVLTNNPCLCVRNALDCSDVLSDRKILSMSAQAIANYIYTDSFETPPEDIWERGFYLIGVANSGAILASHIATLIGAPYLYFIPREKESAYTKKEGILLSENWGELQSTDARVVLIIGANRTGTAIRSAIEMLHEEKGIRYSQIKVVGLINREVMNGSSITKELNKDDISCGFLLHGYQIDICRYGDYEKCPYSKRCKGESVK